MLQIRFQGMKTPHVRAIAAALSHNRDDIPAYNHGGSIAQHWEPTIAAFTVTTPHIPLAVLVEVAEALRDVR